jgi:site-specific DNA-methyltransferase (adenine-specific)
VLQNHITWIKSIATGKDSVGHYKPIGGQRFLNHNHEHIFHLTLTGNVKLDRLAIGVPFKDKSNIARRGHAQDARCRGNTWFIPYQTVQAKAEKFHHPGTFPVDLPRWCIRLHGKANAAVLDPFMGAGTTLIAAAHEGAAGTGMDLDAAYVATAAARLAATLDQIESTNSQTTQASPAIQISERTLAALPR